VNYLNERITIVKEVNKHFLYDNILEISRHGHVMSAWTS